MQFSKCQTRKKRLIKLVIAVKLLPIKFDRVKKILSGGELLASKAAAGGTLTHTLQHFYFDGCN